MSVKQKLRVLAGLAALVFVSVPASAQNAAPTCGGDVKETVVQAVAALDGAPAAQKSAALDALYNKYAFCIQDSQATPNGFFVAAQECGAGVSSLGSLFFEEMSCAGYDPQRRQFAAPVKIKQVFGFGGAPIPGSREYVLHCVADTAGVLQPVGTDSVHLSDALSGNVPTWQFAVITSATMNLQTIQPMNNQTRNARSILSWELPPTGCNYVPIWGNALDYRIRLDQ